MKNKYKIIEFKKGYKNFLSHDEKEEIPLISEEGRYYSWNIIYDLTGKVVKKDESINLDYYTLNMCMYLASWGMYRGSTRLLQKLNYKALKPVMEVVMSSKYHKLYSLTSIDKYNEDIIKLIIKLYDEIKNELRKVFNKTAPLRRNNKNNGVKEIIKTDGVTGTLITKIMLGSYGCVVAYDNFVKKQLSNIGITSTIDTSQKFEKSLKQTVEYIREWLQYKSNDDEYYPIMKLFDMSLFGMDLINE